MSLSSVSACGAIVDSLRRTPHPSHFTVEEALGWIARLAPKRAVLTNMHIDLDYDTLRSELPPHVEPAYDGMTLEIAYAAGVEGMLPNQARIGR